MPSAAISRLLQSGILLLVVTARLTGQTPNNFEWKDASGTTRNLSDLQEILRKHQQLGIKADLSGAHLSGANLTGAQLSGAVLTGAILDHADLRDAALNGAQLSGANLGGALFEPSSLPELRGIAAAKNLELLTYVANPDALVQLRQQFRDGGFREQERKITYALKRREAELSREKCTSRKRLRRKRQKQELLPAKRSRFLRQACRH